MNDMQRADLKPDLFTYALIVSKCCIDFNISSNYVVVHSGRIDILYSLLPFLSALYVMTLLKRPVL